MPGRVHPFTRCPNHGGVLFQAVCDPARRLPLSRVAGDSGPHRPPSLRPMSVPGGIGWETFLGGLVLVVLAVDAFVTVLHASSGAGPYTSLQNRVLWRVGRVVAAHLPGRRQVLSSSAPLMTLATPVAWITFLMVGFALLYHPVIGTFPADPPLEVRGWAASLYLSGYLTTTLGIGDVVPAGAVWRIAFVVQSALGFALFSASITYILAIYGRHTEDAALALHIHNLFRDSELADWGAEGSDHRRTIRSLAISMSGGLAEVNVAHEMYPILHYFHGRPERTLLVQVGRLIDLTEGAPEEERRGPVRPLERAISDFLDQMPFETAGQGSLRERHRCLVEAHGFDAQADDAITSAAG